jgi:tetratricopeptide (TPR) repeat protein
VCTRRVAVAALLLAATRAWAQDAATQQLLSEADRYYDQGEYERAASNYDRAIRAQPKDVPAAAYAKRASIFLFQKSYDDGLTWITGTAERAWPDDDLVLEQKAVILSRLEGKKKDAVELAERVVARRPSAYTLQSLLGDFYYQRGAAAADKTAAHYEAYLKNRPGDLSGQDGLVRVKLGFSYLHLGRFPDAEKQLDETLRSFGGDAALAANARKGLCAAYAGVGNWDRALTLCERVLDDKKALRGDASPQYNAGLAYLNRDRLDEAMRSADAFVALRPKEAKGYLLRGEVLEKRNRLPEAEAQLNQAETLAPSDGDVARELGRIYLRQKRAAKAIDKLTRAVAARPDDVDTHAVLIDAYLADGQGQAAATQAERALKIPGQEKSARFMVLAGEGYYEAGQLPAARGAFERALAAGKGQGGATESRARGLLVDTINRQAGDRLAADDLAGTEKLLGEARELDPESSRTTFNLGLVAVQRGDYNSALRYLGVRYQRTPADLLTNRLMAKAYLGLGNEAKANEHYGRAADEATARRNPAVLAEVNTEWAPLLVKAGKLDEAVDRLEQAIQVARGQPFEHATKRNLALASFRRGYERLRARRGAEAVADLEAATRDPSVLAGNEPDVFGFALGLAYLDTGQVARATALFNQAAAAERKGGALPFLKPPFDAIGGDFFAAYTQYRDGSPNARARAITLLEKLQTRAGGGLGAKIRDVLRSAWEGAAFDAYNRGQTRDAEAALKKASALAPPDKRAAIDHNTAVLEMDRAAANARAALSRLVDRVPEALVNLGILAEREGDTKAAYDDWSQARARGARTPHLDEWIDTKKRLFGY